jgi:hypothetical protein
VINASRLTSKMLDEHRHRRHRFEMRIHLPLPASLFNASAKPKSDAPPIVQLGGELVLMELQGEIQVEGERAGGVVGVLGFERPVRTWIGSIAC